MATAARKLVRDGVVWKRSITYAILGLFQEIMAYKPAFHICSAIVDTAVSFMPIAQSYFLEKHYIPQYYGLTS